MNERISKEEVERCVKRQKNGKAAGLDGIPYEMYENGGEVVIDRCSEAVSIYPSWMAPRCVWSGQRWCEAVSSLFGWHHVLCGRGSVGARQCLPFLDGTTLCVVTAVLVRGRVQLIPPWKVQRGIWRLTVQEETVFCRRVRVRQSWCEAGSNSSLEGAARHLRLPVQESKSSVAG
ncbi:hypothetical protein E2C01_016266 [Portunus trituberculatus]|uniref:Reverse transcriptase domain-containing protein n=1 Tax=Portunus trituberculatus TaxID=210409 RepID=A0A5B7DQL6_PORTR|nr:hypothetical protein [Portunus trituberculatus]